jgi:hypothetical protein
VQETPRKAFLGIGPAGIIGTAIVIAAVIIMGLPQALIRFAVEVFRAALR